MAPGRFPGLSLLGEGPEIAFHFLPANTIPLKLCLETAEKQSEHDLPASHAPSVLINSFIPAACGGGRKGSHGGKC